MAALLTPSGYKEIADCHVGDEVVAFDLDTGAPIINQIESLQWVDAAEWVRWHTNADLPPFRFFRINGTWTLNSEQSIWRNGTEVCHAKHLVVGDVLYDDADQPVTIASIEEVTTAGWWRFDISGDHSYIVDGLTLHNASRFWVGGTGTWDLSATTHWSGSTGGASGSSAPGSADAVTLDGASGGGTVTPSYGGTGTFQSITCGAFTGTIDWSTNNNSVTLSANTGFSNNASGTRTINLGNGTWTIQGTGTPWNMGTTTGLTFNANSSNITFTATSASARTMSLGNSLSFSTVTVSANSGGGSFKFDNATTIATFSVSPQNFIVLSGTLTVTNALNINGTSLTSAVGFATSTPGAAQSISSANNGTFTYCGFRDITFAGGGTFTATNSADLGHNSGITITAPSSASGMLYVPSLEGV